MSNTNPKKSTLEKKRKLHQTDLEASNLDNDVVCLNGTLTVTCYDGQQNTLPGVSVTVTTGNSSLMKTKTTPIGGKVVFDLPDGRYRISAQLNGYITYRIMAAVQANADTPINPILRQTAITVTVFRQGNPTDPTTITATPQNGNQPIQPSRRVAAGIYRFTDLAAGTYTIEATGIGYLDVSKDANANVGTETAVNLVLIEQALVVTVNGPDGNTVANAAVTATGDEVLHPDESVATAIFYDPPARTYSVDAAATDLISAGAVNVDVQQGVVTRHTLTLHRSLLYVKVTNAAKEPLTATVGAVNKQTSTRYDPAVADDDTATYRFDDLPAGAYELSADADGHVGMWNANYQLGAGRSDYTFTLYERVLKVTVKDTNGDPIEGAGVAAGYDGLLTNTDGWCEFFDVDAATYNVTAAKRGYIDDVQQVVVGDGLVEHAVTLRTPELIVTVVDHQGNAVTNVAVTVTKGTTDYDAAAQTTTQFTYRGCPPGTYTIRTAAANFGAMNETATLGANDVTVPIVMYRTTLTIPEFEDLLYAVVEKVENDYNRVVIQGVPDTNWCGTVIRKERRGTKTVDVTNAMDTGTAKHTRAETLLKQRMASRQLEDPYALAIEQAYIRENGVTRTANQYERGTIRPDVLIYQNGDLTDVVRIYDFKFTCPPTNQPHWRQTTSHAGYEKKAQNVAYAAILRPSNGLYLVNPTHGYVQ